MPAPPHTAAPAQRPDPPQDPAPAASPTYTARLLGLVRKLIDFGHEIAAAVQQHPTGEDHVPLALRFGTKSIALMLASIARGLRLAAVLEERLGGPPARLNPAQATARALSRRRPRAPRDASPTQDNGRARLPTSRKIAAWYREYPVETVLMHLRSALGLTPDDPLWEEVNDLLIEHHADRMRQAQEIRKQDQATAAPRSQESESRGRNASARGSDTQTQNQYRASLMRSTSRLLPDMPPMPPPVTTAAGTMASGFRCNLRRRPAPKGRMTINA